MPEPGIPPMSSTVAQYRAEVGRRSDALGRRRRGRALGGVAGALALVVVGSLAAVQAGTPSHVSASGAIHAPRAPGRPAPTSTADAAGSTAASPQLSTGQSANSPTFGAVAPGGFAVVDQEPSGSKVTAGADAKVLVVLPGITGTWGPAVVTRGRGTVLTIVSQRHVGGRTEVVVRTHRPGTGSIVVPMVNRSTARWSGTIVVTGTR